MRSNGENLEVVGIELMTQLMANATVLQKLHKRRRTFLSEAPKPVSFFYSPVETLKDNTLQF